MIVPFPAGGGSDVVARIVAMRMRAALGQPVIIENIGGANGSIGIGRLARAPSDGYTMSIGSWPTQVVNGAVYALSYDLQTDVEPIALLVSNPALILAKKAMPADDLSSLVAWLRANPGMASLGTAGVGSGGHVNGVFLQNITGTRFQIVPYRGDGPAMQDLIAGQIDLLFGSASSLPQVRSGVIKAYAVMAKQRLPGAPEIPTVDEAGLPGFYYSNWHSLWVPKGASKAIIARLNDAVVSTLADPSIRQKLAGQSLDIPAREHQSPEALRILQKTEIAKWWPIIKEAGIKAQ